jgi:iron complex transport system permease protein
MSNAPATTETALPRRPSASPPIVGWGLLVGALALLVALQLSVGLVYVPLAEVVRLLAGAPGDEVWARIVLEFRLPRMLTAVAAGSALGLCGLLLQTVFRNPLADPWFLGLVHSARLGVAILIILSGTAGGALLGGLGLLNNLGIALAAGAGALGMTLVLVALAPRVGAVTLLLTGLMLGQTAEGLISVLLHFTTEAQGRAFSSWNDGTFTAVTLSQWWILAAVAVIGMAAAVALAKPLNSLLLGDDYARTLGLSVARTRMGAVTVAALLAGVVTAFCGPVAFVGILAPHLARALFSTADHRSLVPAAALVGASLASLADFVTHLPWSQHFLHMNAVLGLVGGPVVVVLLLRQRGGRRLEG